jgi:hypothetical protein
VFHLADAVLDVGLAVLLGAVGADGGQGGRAYWAVVGLFQVLLGRRLEEVATAVAGGDGVVIVWRAAGGEGVVVCGGGLRGARVAVVDVRMRAVALLRL